MILLLFVEVPAPLAAPAEPLAVADDGVLFVLLLPSFTGARWRKDELFILLTTVNFRHSIYFVSPPRTPTL